MKSCNGCKYANWERTANGSLHPSGEGTCTYFWIMPPLPSAFRWPGSMTPRPYGGAISRRKEYDRSCQYFVRSKT